MGGFIGGIRPQSFQNLEERPWGAITLRVEAIPGIFIVILKWLGAMPPFQ